ncbi:ADP-ribose pyrophosphatase [Verrucomicrobia bacterium LW23]|nr:ADP-ribose pyrophosphatase [Verrucomicrobia bacterium LW23]
MRNLLDISREIAAIAQTGLTYTKDPYDSDRFKRLHQIANELLEDPERAPAFRWPEEIGYPTPKVDVRGVIFKGPQVLLIKEAVSQLWTLPGGWADVNLTPRENVERECWEETGYRVTATALVSVIDRERAGYPRFAYTVFKMFFLCTIVSGTATPSLESSHIEFFDIDCLPEMDLHRSHPVDIERAYAFSQSSGPSHFN